MGDVGECEWTVGESDSDMRDEGECEWIVGESDGDRDRICVWMWLEGVRVWCPMMIVVEDCGGGGLCVSVDDLHNPFDWGGVIVVVCFGRRLDVVMVVEVLVGLVERL